VKTWHIIILLLLVFGGELIFFFQFTTPACFLRCRDELPLEEFVIEPEATETDILTQLKDDGLIRSPLAFKILPIIYRNRTPITPGAYELRSSMMASEVFQALHTNPTKKWVTVPAGLKPAELAAAVGQELSLDATAVAEFSNTYEAAAKVATHDSLLSSLTAENTWAREEAAIATKLYDAGGYNLYGYQYKPGRYLLAATGTGEELARNLFSQTKLDNPFTPALLDPAEKVRLASAVKAQVELKPDIVPLPPSDISVINRNGQILLIFSSAYWNQGRGPLELVPGARHNGITGIYQRIYKAGGTYRTLLAGTFIWHPEHAHYHFDDFMHYILESTTAGSNIIPKREKTSFCLRDRDYIKKLPNTPTKAKYGGCNTNLQGVSVGWGDTYKFTLADQDINITNLPAGLYRLRFEVNVNRKFEEIDTSNNTSSVLLYIDPARLLVEVRN
jgi:hypothetical protein